LPIVTLFDPASFRTKSLSVASMLVAADRKNPVSGFGADRTSLTLDRGLLVAYRSSPCQRTSAPERSMNRSSYESSDPIIDQLAELIDETLEADRSSAIRQALVQLSNAVGSRYSVNLSVIIDVFDQLAELDARTEEEWVAADEAAASESKDQAVVTVPTALLPEVRKLLAAHKTA
jgi:hypothetical protein